MKILGIETSCDETAAAIVDDQKNILSSVINSQVKLHEQYGGVVPELAARSHAEILDKIIKQALKDANLELKDIDAIAATAGPGLIGGVMVGLMTAKTLASITKKPFIAINHLEAHLLTARLSGEINFPFLTLLISGGHCQILYASEFGKYEKLGETIDDALGESFDKVAQMLGLEYPGGPQVEKLARVGDEKKFKFPRPLIDQKDKKHLYDFSFSGLKTAVRREIEKLAGEEFSHASTPKKLTNQNKADICASFQRVVCEIIINRLENVFQNKKIATSNIVIAGGVAANRYIFEKLSTYAKEKNLNIITPPLKLCTDNAAMIAWAGVERFKLDIKNDLDFTAKAKWNLDELNK